MKTQFVYTFKTRKQVLNHLRALVQLSTSIAGCNFSISDYNKDYPDIYDALSYIKCYPGRRIYVAFRSHGFEYGHLLTSFTTRLSSFNDVILTCKIVYNAGYYELREFEL